MGVDHGLGGRDNKKSREKRDKRFRKKEAKAKMMFAMPVKKRELVFNEQSRVDYLTGFRQRKKERRQYGIAMQVLKDKKSLRDKRPKLGKLLQDEGEIKEKDVQFNDSENEEEAGDLSVLGKREVDVDPVSEVEEREVKFSDEGTTAMFGGEVSVIVDTNIAEQLDDAAHVFSARTARNMKKPPTALEKAMKKAKNIMHLKIINKNKHIYIKKGDEKGDISSKGGGKGGNRGGGKGSKAIGKNMRKKSRK